MQKLFFLSHGYKQAGQHLEQTYKDNKLIEPHRTWYEEYLKSTHNYSHAGLARFFELKLLERHVMFLAKVKAKRENRPLTGAVRNYWIEYRALKNKNKLENLKTKIRGFQDEYSRIQDHSK